ncbi:MAG: hypothetical protein ACI84K_001645 [Pseudohongiellaceae bacterium]|jgi:hypothetical protein
MKCLQNLCSSALVFFIISSTQLTANELDLRINDDAIHANYATANESTMFGLGYFYKESSSSTNIINTDLHAKGQTAIGNLPMTIGVGFQGNFFKKDHFRGSTVGLGGSLRINIPEALGLSIETALHYAPEVLSFGDADEFRRFRLQANYHIIQNADISVGYHYLNVGNEDINSNHTLESSVFIGMKLKF